MMEQQDHFFSASVCFGDHTVTRSFQASSFREALAIAEKLGGEIYSLTDDEISDVAFLLPDQFGPLEPGDLVGVDSEPPSGDQPF